MPKQILKIENFDGGINTINDPRDIADNQMVSIVDFSIHKQGKLVLMGGVDTHSEVPADALTIEPGYGLYAFRHDRLFGWSTQTNHFSQTHAHWADEGSGTWANSAGPTITYSSNSTTTQYIRQTSANRNAGGGHVGLDSKKYVFRYKVTKVAGGNTATPVIKIAEFASPAVTITIPGLTSAGYPDGYNSIEEVIFTSTSDVVSNTRDFRLDVTTAGHTDWELKFEDMELICIDETGDNYLALVDADITGKTHVYSQLKDAYGHPIQDRTNVDGGNRKEVFYMVDGNLRMCDSNFGNTNSTTWLGFINSSRYAGTGQSMKRSYNISSWVNTDAALKSPTDLLADAWDSQFTVQARTTGSSGLLGNINPASIIKSGTATSTSSNKLVDSGGGFSGVVTNKDYAYNITDGTGGFIDSHTDTELTLVDSSGSPTDPFASGESYEIYKNQAAKFGTLPEEKHGIHIRLYSDSTHNDFSDGNGWDKVWNCGYTLIYDGRQESAMHVIQNRAGNIVRNYDGTTATNVTGLVINGTTGHDDGDGDYDGDLGNITDSTNFAEKKVKIYAYVQQGINRKWNERITGFNIYLREDGTNGWFLQAEVDLNLGIRDVSTNSRSLKGWQHSSASGVHDAVLYTVTEPLTSPSNIISYEAMTGYEFELHNFETRFKTATVANRRAYIGNVQFYDKSNTLITRPDMMIKSPVDRYDIFTENRSVEASVNDGDEIVHLLEFADRILQFKKQKVHIINVSQDLEYLEATYLHKGVDGPWSVTKTPYGIAWANQMGAYFYDGQKVTDLIGRNLAQNLESNYTTWTNFLSSSDVVNVGFDPEYNQLIFNRGVVSSASNDNVLIYDMIKKSWVEGKNKVPADATSGMKTNFQVDWNNHLIFAHSSSGTTVRWDNTPDTSSNIKLITKDFDVGAPAIRKKIYKVYVSYKGNGTAVTVGYGTDGNTTMTSQFFRCNPNGSTTGGTSSTTPFHQGDVDVDDWVCAELKPASSINNVYSFQLKFDGGSTDATFEINDITIVYRLKSIK